MEKDEEIKTVCKWMEEAQQERDIYKAQVAELQKKLDEIAAAGGGVGLAAGGVPSNVNPFIYPNDAVKLYKTNWSKEVRFFNCDITSREIFPKDSELKDLNFEQMQPLKIGQNTRAILAKFGEMPVQIVGKTANPLFFTTVIDQLKANPSHHIAKIQARSTKYTGQCGFGTHIEVEFLTADGYVLGKLQNVHKEREVVANWIERKKMRVVADYPKVNTLYDLKLEEAIVGVEIGISKISEEREQVESIKFKIANFKEKN